jgi:hypothetical protein
VTVAPNASGSVTFDALTVADANMRGVIRAGTDAMPKDNDFYFVLSPSRPVSVLILQSDGVGPETSLYISAGLAGSKAPPFKTDVVTLSRFVPGNLDGRAVVILNDATSLPTTAVESLGRFVEQGGGLFVILGAHTPVNSDWPLLPGTLAAPVDRMGSRGGTFGTMDFSHPIFEQFKEPRNGNFANMRFFRYRRLVTGPADRVLVRYDDGGTAMVERRVGSGRVLALTSTVDRDWNEFPTHPMFVPVLNESVKYLAQYGEPQPWHIVGRMLDISAPVASLVRSGQASRTQGAAKGGVVVSPSEKQVTLGGEGTPSIELAEQGFYSVRLPGMGDQRPFSVAVNLDPAESDLSPLSPTEFLAGATGRAAVTTGGQSLEHPELAPSDIEKKQSLWWYLLVVGLFMLLAEAVLSNRLSKRFGIGIRQMENQAQAS